jgi:hypothetical protein
MGTRNRLTVADVVVMAIPLSNRLVHFLSLSTVQLSFAQFTAYLSVPDSSVPSIPSHVIPEVDSIKSSLQVTVAFDTEPLNTISRVMEVIKFTCVCCYTCISFL